MVQFVPPKKNDPNGYIFYTALGAHTANGSFQTNPTLATGDVKVSIDGGAFNNLGTLPAVTPAGGKAVKVTLAQAEVNADNVTVVFSDVVGAEWCDKIINFQTVSRQIDDLTYPTVSGRSVLIQVAGTVSANVTNFSSATIANTNFASGAVDANALATGAVNEIANGLLDLASGVETNVTVRKALRLYAAALLGKASGMSTTTATFRDTNDTKNRIVATVDSTGNRSAVTLDST